MKKSRRDKDDYESWKKDISERGKNCKLCKGHISTTNGFLNNSKLVFLQSLDNTLTVSLCVNGNNEGIRYCPMCGRKLKTDE